MRTAFVVLTYNRSDALLAVLRALAAAVRSRDDVVVIADDGSRPEHVQVLRDGLPAFACPVRHVWHPDVGFTAARARNLGALHAQADYLVFLDGDCVPNRRFAAHHRALAQAGPFRQRQPGAAQRTLEPARRCAGEIELPQLAAPPNGCGCGWRATLTN